MSVINHLQAVDLSRCVCIGADFNCTFEPGMDRNTPEPHPESCIDLSLFFSLVGLLDVWRVLYPQRIPVYMEPSYQREVFLFQT